MNLLDRKLMRDILAMRGQMITIALVVAAGIAVFVASVSTFETLRAARDRFYAGTHFPQLFVTLKRAPLSVVARLTEIPGVAVVEPRIVRDVIIDWPSAVLPVSARVISLSHAGDETLARLYLRRGGAPQAGDAHGAVINEAFAEANGVRPGATVRAVLNGRLQGFTITGIALSPEHVYAVKPGMPIPDDRFYAILWVDRAAAEAAFDMKGAFNDLVVSLAPGADARAVIADLDRILGPYGSVGAIERRDQSSNRFLADELNQQKVMSITIPVIFFAVASFLLNVALGRLVTAQREQIAALKALGFGAAPLVMHYLKLVSVIVFFGSLVGVAAGYVFGSAMIGSYQGFFRMPALAFELAPWSLFAGITICFAAASLGVVSALRTVMALPPAVAMQPVTPRRFGASLIESVLPAPLRSPRRLITLRSMAGRPVRTALTVAGLSLALPLVVLGLFWRDAIDHMIDVQFNRVERGNALITFSHPQDQRIIGDLGREPGVLLAEGYRIVPVRLHAGHRDYLTAVIGLPPGSELRRPHDAALRPITVPPDGITLTRRLAERLGVGPGDSIAVEVMEGRRRTRDLVVSARVDEAIGMASYMDMDSLNRITGEGAVVSTAALYVEPSALPSLADRFKDFPVIESMSMKQETLASFLDKIAGLVMVSAGILTGFAVIVAVGVVYNSARIALQERAWELASLRVLGFTRAEVAAILFAPFALEVALSIPVGVGLSDLIIGLISRYQSNESFEIPAVIEPRTHAAAIMVVVAAAMASAAVVRREVDRLDLVSVLKTRE